MLTQYKGGYMAAKKAKKVVKPVVKAKKPVKKGR